MGRDMKKFHQTKLTPKRIAEISDRLCREYGLSVVIPDPIQTQKRRYTNNRITPFRTILKNDIDRAIEKSDSFDDFLACMRENYYIKTSGKYLTFCHRTNGQRKAIRATETSLGAAYTEANIRRRLLGQPIETVQDNPALRLENELVLEPRRRLGSRKEQLQAIFHAHGLLENYHIHNYDEILPKINSLLQKADTCQSELRKMEQHAAKLKGLLDCYDTVQRLKGLAQEYGAALLKDRFYTQHREELDTYQSASTTLTHLGYVPDDPAVGQKLQDLYDASGKEMQRIWDTYNSLQSQLADLHEAKRAVEQAVLQEKKPQKGEINL